MLSFLCDADPGLVKGANNANCQVLCINITIVTNVNLMGVIKVTSAAFGMLVIICGHTECYQ